jgi:hypothetical protein
LICVALSSCDTVSANDPHSSYLMLSPRSTVELSYFGECKKLTNRAKRGVAYLVVGDADVWHALHDRIDQRGFKVIEVRPCAF